jgi:biopolymer transport protein ExbD
LSVAATAAKSNVSEKILFLRISTLRIDLNSDEVQINSLSKSIKSFTKNAKASLVVSMDQDVTSQRLVDILGIVANIEGLSVNLIGSS